jgi:hypothetical protein
MFELTGRELYDYGTMIFVLWLSQFLVREIWKLFKVKLNEIGSHVDDNKLALSEMSKTLKEVAIIQAQTLSKMKEGDNNRNEAWSSLLEILQKMCGLLNGNNPAIMKLQTEMKELKDNMK